MNPLYSRVAERAGHRCEYCRAPEAVFNFPFEVEHVVPPGRGGSHDDSNLALSCRSCNIFKTDAIDAIDPHSGKRHPLFNPRHDVWEEHFSVDARTGILIGSTPVGRATITLLQINGRTQVAARKIWVKLKLFP